MLVARLIYNGFARSLARLTRRGFCPPYGHFRSHAAGAIWLTLAQSKPGFGVGGWISAHDDDIVL
jgi:hypothetical protein